MGELLVRYEESGIDERILRAVEEMGFVHMTPIQEKAIPVFLEGRDVIGQAQTGTGKTAAFGIPMLQKIDEEDRSLQGMILCPTRELAMQAAQQLRQFAKYMHNIRVLAVYGGQDINRQIKALKGGVQIIVGTPGRVMDHMRRHTIRLDNLKMVVLDEADEMLNMGFREDMEAILGQIPCEHQTALFSATMPEPILQITDQFQTDAEMVKVVKKELTVERIRQYLYYIRRSDKEAAAARLIEYYNLKRGLIFCNTKSMVDELAENLKNRGIAAEGLHGDLSQAQRDTVMNRFRSGNLQMLIATDVAARGIDVNDVDGVINYDVPQDIEYYVHRIGRTGRAGKEGMSFTLASRRESFRIREIERVCKTKLEEKHLPSGEEVRQHKEASVLQKIREVMEEANTADCYRAVERFEKETGISAIELAAAFLYEQVGGEPEEIVEEPKVVRRDGERRFGIDAGMDLEAETVDVSATVIREADVSMTATREMADASERKTAATVRNATAGRDVLATTAADRTDGRQKTAAEEELPVREAIAQPEAALKGRKDNSRMYALRTFCCYKQSNARSASIRLS